MAQDRPPCYELFFAPLHGVLNPRRLERVKFAYIASKFGHAGQVRDGGGRYFDHPKSAAWIYIDELGGRNARVICDLLLHDISEDSYLLSPYRMGLNFGEKIAMDVRALTKLPKGKETVEEYLARIINRGPEAIISKLCDRLHNLRTLDRCSKEKRKRQINETRQDYLPLLIPALRKHGETWARYADMLANKIEFIVKY